MIDLFSFDRATLKADSYFSSFTDGSTFKCFREGEAPVSITEPFITIDIQDGEQDQRTGWATPFVTHNVTGLNTQRETLHAIGNKIVDIFEARDVFATVGGTTVQYVLIGKPLFSWGENPVTEHVVRSVALRFGIVT